MSQEDVFLTQGKNQTQAVKVIPLDEEMTSFLEIDILRRFHHPYLLHAKDFFILDDQPYCLGLILPLGKWTLENVIKQRLITHDKYVDLIWKLACALVFLHEQNILHLNLCPENIILRGEEEKIRPLIADFRSCHYGREVYSSYLYTRQEYLSPEILDNNVYHYTSKTDIWALGVIFLEILSGQRYSSLGIEAEEELRSPMMRIKFLEEQLPPHYHDAVDLLFRMLDPNPETRLDSKDLLMSSFFTSRIKQQPPEGKVNNYLFDDEVISASVDENYYTLIANLDNFSLKSWQSAYYLSSLFNHDPNLIWIILYLCHKIYDEPYNYALDYFLELSQLSYEEFLIYLKEIILYLDGVLIN